MNWAGIGCQGLETGLKICVLIPGPWFPALGPNNGSSVSHFEDFKQ